VQKLPGKENIAHAHPNRKEEKQVLNPFIIIVMKNSSPQSDIPLWP
jgi:hypothetical protein